MIPSLVVLLLIMILLRKPISTHANILALKTMLHRTEAIGHNLDHMKHAQTSLSQIFGHRPVEFCHNPTAMSSEEDYMGHIGDLSQCTAQKLGRITAKVDELVGKLISMHFAGREEDTRRYTCDHGILSRTWHTFFAVIELDFCNAFTPKMPPTFASFLVNIQPRGFALACLRRRLWE